MPEIEAETTEQKSEGWQAEKQYSQRIYHYIVDTFSLCGRLGFYAGELMPDNPERRGAADCKACVKKLEARKKKANHDY